MAATASNVEQLLHGAQVQMPPAHGTFKQAQKVKQDESHWGQTLRVSRP